MINDKDAKAQLLVSPSRALGREQSVFVPRTESMFHSQWLNIK
jgi:hypothetical protein